ncbi:hypothetical protein GM418_10905 [Maribellus comscasis]|uniref:Uncharacterized protein n=1 Tax=Maribellus comscasis TaxID=2681766 RepID=A0A6I6JSE1_9BACT|nr:hypothetical protein [Maribellus comscasis]QGY44149.1 hypothetical protein GM418_10905 [Maribellus comscasis]
MEAKVIHKNETEIRATIELASRVIPHVKDLNKLLELDGIKPSTQHLKGFYQNGSEHVRQILLVEAKKDVDGLKWKSERLRRALLNDAISIDISEYQKVHSSLTNAIGKSKVTVEDIQMSGKDVKLRQSFIDAVDEEFTIVIDTEEKKLLWDNIQNFCTSYNKIQDILHEIGETSISDAINPAFEEFFTCENKLADFIKIYPDPNFFLWLRKPVKFELTNVE